MQSNKITLKQIAIQLGINLVASAIVSYAMYKILSNREESQVASATTVTKVETEPKPVATTTVEG